MEAAVKANNQEKPYGMFKNLLWSIKLYWGFSKLLFSLKIVERIQEYTFPLISAAITGLIIDAIINFNETRSADNLYLALIIFAVYYIFFKAFLGALSNYSVNATSLRLSYEILEKIRLKKVKSLSLGALETPELQNLHTRYIETAYSLSQFFSVATKVIVLFLTIVATAVTLLTLIPLATLLIVLLTLPTYFASKAMLGRLFKIDLDMTIQLRRENAVYTWLSDVKYLKEIKQINAFEYLFKYVKNFIEEKYQRVSSVYVLWGKLDLLTSLFVVGAIIFAIFQLIELAINGSISVGQIAFFLAALNSLSGLIDSFFSYFADLSGYNDRVSEARKFLDYKDNYRFGEQELVPFTKPPAVKLENVSFTYPNSDRLALKNLNLEIKPGEKIAIVGENGAGKSTLIKLISGIYPVSSGNIFVNNQKLNEIEQESWFNNLGVLYQDYNIYEDLTVFENIAMGKINEEIDYEKLRDAAKKADAEEFIMAYKDNYSQVLSERYEGGVRPSTGQWQKIAIARFFYRDAPILILDEPTSAIDAVAEAAIFERIYESTKEKTVIIVSHRFSTVRNADRIIVFDKGEIVEDGTHEQLLSLGGKYAEAFRLQAKGYN